jgi:succinate-acetate transporter protein
MHDETGIPIDVARDDEAADVLTPANAPPPRRHTRINSIEYRNNGSTAIDDSPLIVVRYFLDRPGYGLHNSAARLWFHPPTVVTPGHVREFLTKQGIALEGLLVEVYLDKFGSFMMLEACEHSLVEWDFSGTNHRAPGIINVRLTDLMNAQQEEAMTEGQKGFPTIQQQTQGPQHANTTPVGLFAFSMMVGLETIALMAKMFPDLVDKSFHLTWGPYMIFVGGLLQFVTGLLQVFRNNLYGATAFLTFGCFWFANGVAEVLKNHFSGDGTRAQELLDSNDPGGYFFRQMYILAFCCVLLIQTFVMNRLSSTLITLLCLKVAAASVTGWSEDMEWVQLVFGTLTSLFSFWVFLVELTNQIYHREIFPVYKWSEKHSPQEAFGASGRLGTLHSKAARLRQASYPNVRTVREAKEEDEQEHLKES